MTGESDDLVLIDEWHVALYLPPDVGASIIESAVAEVARELRRCVGDVALSLPGEKMSRLEVTR